MSRGQLTAQLGALETAHSQQQASIKQDIKHKDQEIQSFYLVAWRTRALETAQAQLTESLLLGRDAEGQTDCNRAARGSKTAIRSETGRIEIDGKVVEERGNLAEIRARAHHGWNVVRQIAGTMSEEEAEEKETAEMAQLVSQRLHEQVHLLNEKEAVLKNFAARLTTRKVTAPLD